MNSKCNLCWFKNNCKYEEGYRKSENILKTVVNATNVEPIIELNCSKFKMDWFKFRDKYTVEYIIYK